MHNLLAVLQAILRSYSSLPIQQLFDNNLCINIFLISNTQLAKEIFKQKFPTTGKAKQQLFFKGDLYLLGNNFIPNQTENGRYAVGSKQIFVYVVVSHPKAMAFHRELIFKKQKDNDGPSNKLYNNYVQSLICVTTQGQIFDNIIEIDEKAQKHITQQQVKGFFLRIPFQQKGIQQVLTQVSLFLSVYEFFHSHSGLILSIHQINSFQHLQQLITMSHRPFQEDDDELLACSIYCRIFEAMPFKITYKQIVQIADVESQYWGEKIRINQGSDGIIFWFLFNHHTILVNEQNLNKHSNNFNIQKVTVSQKFLAEKAALKLTEQKHGHIIFKSRSLTKESLQNLGMTVIILNFKKPKYCISLNKIFDQTFEKEIKIFCQNRAKARQFRTCQKVCDQIERLSELLVQIKDENTPQANEDQEKEAIKEEAQQLSYSINRWLFLKGKENK